MSYLIGVWQGATPADDAEAAHTFERLADASMTASAPASAALAAYVRTLTDRYPDLTDVADDKVDESPWADGPLIGNVIGDFFMFAVVADAAEEVLPFIAETARQHGLVAFDPQAERILT